MDTTLIEQFSQIADKYAAFTEIQYSISQKRGKLFSTMISVWEQLSYKQRMLAKEYLVQLNRDSKMSLPSEPMFSLSFQDALQASSKEFRR